MSVHIASGRIKLLSSGSALPNNTIDNTVLLEALEQLCGRKARRLAQVLAKRIGVETRYLSRDLYQARSSACPSAPELSAIAVQQAQNGYAEHTKLDYLIGHTCTPHTLIPASSAWTVDQLQHAGPYLELRQACTGFANALQIAVPMLHKSSGMSEIAIVGTEVGSVYFDMSADFINTEQLLNYVQMGDGAGAVLLGPDDGSHEHIISDCYFGHIGLNKSPGFQLIGGGSGQVFCDKGLPVFKHDAKSVKSNGVELFLHGIAAIQRQGYQLEDFAYIIPHQANGYIGKLIADYTGIAEQRFICDAKQLGNMGSAAIWVSFDRLRRSGVLNKGDKVLILGAEATKYLYGGFVYTH